MSVMVGEVLDALRPRDGGLYVDGTVGLGGHAAAILRASAPGGRLIIRTTQMTRIEAAGERLGEASAAGRRAYLFGSGHSVIPVMDVFPR